MDTVTDVASNVVRQSDGTLALRHYKIEDMAQEKRFGNKLWASWITIFKRINALGKCVNLIFSEITGEERIIGYRYLRKAEWIDEINSWPDNTPASACGTVHQGLMLNNDTNEVYGFTKIN